MDVEDIEPIINQYFQSKQVEQYFRLIESYIEVYKIEYDDYIHSNFYAYDIYIYQYNISGNKYYSIIVKYIPQIEQYVFKYQQNMRIFEIVHNKTIFGALCKLSNIINVSKTEYPNEYGELDILKIKNMS